MAQETVRKGGKWEAAGFGMCALGVVVMVSAPSSDNGMVTMSIGGALLAAGLVVFLVGRFM